MQDGSPESDRIITGTQRAFRASVRVQWLGDWGHPLSDLDKYITDVSIDTQLQGTVPSAVNLIEGSAAGKMVVTVAGDFEGQNLVGVFAPYNGRSPFYRKEIIGSTVSAQIVVYTAEGEESFQQFKGVVRSVSPDRGSNTVALECLDHVEALRKPVSFAPWAVSMYWQSRGYIRGQLCDSQWIIDNCLRHCDTSPTPWRPAYRRELGVPQDTADGVQFWLSGTGSHVPTVGWVDNPHALSFPLTEETGLEMYSGGGNKWDWDEVANPGPAPLCLNDIPYGPGNSRDDGARLRYWVRSRYLLDKDATHYLGLTIFTDGSNAIYTADYPHLFWVNIGAAHQLQIRLHDGQVYTQIHNTDTGEYRASARYTIDDVNYDEHTISAQWDTSPETGFRYWMSIESGHTEYAGSGTWVDVTDLPLGTNSDLRGLVEVNHYVKMQDVGYAIRNIYDAATYDMHNLRRSATYPAVLDAGRNRMNYTPQEVNGSDAWDIIKEVAAAEWGSVFWDEAGAFHFWNYDTMLNKQGTTVREFSLDDVTGLAVTRTLDSIRNVFSVEIERRVAIRRKTVYEASSRDEFLIRAGTTVDFRLWDTGIQYIEPFGPRRHSTLDTSPHPKWTDDSTNAYVCQWLINGKWQEEESAHSGEGVAFDGLFFDIDGSAIVRIRNGWAEDCRLSTNNESGALRLDGTKIESFDPLIYSARFDDSIEEFEERNMKIKDKWVQDRVQARMMTDTIGPRMKRPVPITDNITIAGDPRLQLGDTILITDPEGLGDEMRAQILGISRSLSVGGGLTDTLTVEIIEPPSSGVWGSYSYGLWDQSFIWGE